MLPSRTPMVSLKSLAHIDLVSIPSWPANMGTEFSLSLLYGMATACPSLWLPSASLTLACCQAWRQASCAIVERVSSRKQRPRPQHHQLSGAQPSPFRSLGSHFEQWNTLFTRNSEWTQLASSCPWVHPTIHQSQGPVILGRPGPGGEACLSPRPELDATERIS